MCQPQRRMCLCITSQFARRLTDRAKLQLKSCAVASFSVRFLLFDREMHEPQAQPTDFSKSASSVNSHSAGTCGALKAPQEVYIVPVHGCAPRSSNHIELHCVCPAAVHDSFVANVLLTDVACWNLTEAFVFLQSSICQARRQSTPCWTAFWCKCATLLQHVLQFCAGHGPHPDGRSEEHRP